MTVAEAIAEAGRYRPNHKATEEEIAGWLNQLEKKIWIELYSACIFPPLPHEEFDEDTELYVKSPYSVLYRLWLCANIDMLQGDLNNYSVQSSLFEQMYEQYKGVYIQKHKPIHTPEKYW